MIVSLTDMKSYLGETSSDYDSFLTQQILVIQNSIENYCGRKFEIGSYTETVYYDQLKDKLDISKLYLYHFPLISIGSISNEDGEDITEYRTHKPKGYVASESDGRISKWFKGYNKLEIQYTAGYLSVPESIKQVVYNLVGESYNKKKNGIDVGFGNNVQRISVAGVMSVDFDYSLNNNERKNSFGMILGNWLNVLDFYRSERSLLGEIEDTYVS